MILYQSQQKPQKLLPAVFWGTFVALAAVAFVATLISCAYVDILVIAESPLATSEGRIIRLTEVVPTAEAEALAKEYSIDVRLAEIVLQESDEIVGGVPGYLLARRGNLFLPNAGIDESNAPDGMVTLLPKNPDASAKRIRDEIQKRFGKDVAVLVVDSRTHAMRLGVSGVAIGVAGLRPITDERGKKDLFGHELQVTRRAVADGLASTAELLMGEADALKYV